ncbi:sensor histidine kinase [Neomegalonema sp.]|uniref:sensor histidine kinase n=1 Tax=Neomegalonema sp. TaxID=2039713 RepID=UPI00260D17BF|nr:sensor histidine kinase [Neomegalonema sp.]MDD2867439.1 sensor histidine kinase [Neomegalonema sp.]
MISAPVVLTVSGLYLLALFAIAAFADRRAAQGRSVIGNAWIYTLSLAVYCTAWTYFGSVGRAAAGGVWFLPIYLGPMLAMLVAWIVLRKMIRIAQSHRITSIADFIASRYGKSPALAALATVIAVVGVVPYIALQLKAVSAGYQILTQGSGPQEEALVWWRDGALMVALALAAFAILFGTRHLDSAERHEGMVAAIAFESLVKLVAFLAVGAFVTWGLFGGMADVWARAKALPGLTDLLRIDGGQGGGGFPYAEWFGMTMLAMFSVLLLPRQFQMMVVECVDERHVKRAAWAFPAYLLAINLFVLPIALGGLVLFGPGVMDPETFVLSLPLSQGATALALFAYVGGLSAATGMLIVETVAISTMVCNDLVMPALLRQPWFGGRAGGDLTRLLLNIRRAAIVGVLLLGYLYFQIAGDAYALVSIGLISFAAVAQFAPALLGGIYWRGGTLRGAFAGMAGGFLVWIWTLMLPSVAKSGWIPDGFLRHGPFGIGWLAPESLFGLTALDPLSHSLFWSLLVNVALYVGLSLARAPSAREASQALLFVEVFAQDSAQGRDQAPIFWRGRARLEDLTGLAARLLGPEQSRRFFEDYARETRAPSVAQIRADARLVDRVERRLAGVVGSASARVLISKAAQESPLGIEDVMEIVGEASEVRAYARALEKAGAELREANERLKSLDQMKDDFMSSVTHELRTPLTSIRALSELMLDAPDMEEVEREEFLGIIIAESERLGRLVNQVLDLAKIESGHAEWRIVEMDLRKLVSDAARATAELFHKKDAELVLSLPEGPRLLHADPDRLTQVMVNLLSNAAKFMPEAGGRAEILLREEPGWLVVEIRDNGPGVPLADQATIFEKFRQAGDALTRPPGTGLGLPISREIVERFGGSMSLDSQPGQGSCFSFRLPVGREEAAQDRPDA